MKLEKLLLQVTAEDVQAVAQREGYGVLSDEQFEKVAKQLPLYFERDALIRMTLDHVLIDVRHNRRDRFSF